MVEGGELRLLLTDYEKALLAGEHGEGASFAMKVQVAVGECFNASRMVEVSRVHVALDNQEAEQWFVNKLLDKGARCSVAPTVNPGFDLEYLQRHLAISSQDAEELEQTRNSFRELGAILTYSCTPYLEANVPRLGEVLSFSETNVTAYVNAVIGARTNRESVQSSLCAAITGRVPEYGYLLDENRKAEILVQVAAGIHDDFDYRLLGSCVKKIGSGIPVFEGLPLNPSQESLINLGAELNTTGSYAMFHIAGVTPEAPTVREALGEKEPLRVVTITDLDLKEVQESISHPPGRIEFAMFGCPHFTFRQVKQVAELVSGKKLAVEMWVLTSSLNRELARRMGLLEVIESAGGHLVADTCIDQPCWSHLKGKVGVTESPKGAYYARARGMVFVIRDLHTCVEAAIRGEVE
jgi:predicted aconitase